MSLIVVTGSAPSGANSQSIGQTISISGASGYSQAIALTGATFNGGGTTVNQGNQTTVQYTIFPTSGSISVSATVGGTSIWPPIAVIKCTIASIIRGSLTQSSLAIGSGNAQSVAVTFQPALPNTASVKFQVTIASGTIAGSATPSPASLSGAGGSLTVTGVEKSRISTSLQITGTMAGSGAIFTTGSSVSGPPFTVCPHQINMNLNPSSMIPLPGRFDPPEKYGIQIVDTCTSDTSPGGRQGELGGCDYMEQIEKSFQTGTAFPQNPGIDVQLVPLTSINTYNDHITTNYLLLNYGQSGNITYNQVFIYHCKICGADHVVVPNSGFFHLRATDPYNGNQTLQTTVQPSNTQITANGYTANSASGGPATNAATLPSK
jgi:hypothetical protein